MFKSVIRTILEGYVRQYLRRHPEVKLVIVTGSVGKTSTKNAIGTVLSEKFRVRMHTGNHNAELSAPLAILGIEYPDNLRSPSVWRDVFRQARQKVTAPDDVEVIVQEVGSDRIGQVPHFGTYAHPDIAVVSAVSPEHMEYFKTIEAVAAEELAPAKFSKQVLVNQDDIDPAYIKRLAPDARTYGLTSKAAYHFKPGKFSLSSGYEGEFHAPELDESLNAKIQLVGTHNIRPAVAAGAVGAMLGMSSTEIKRGLAAIRPVAGRMQVLKGKNNSTILDDTYNSSPLATAAALQTLYELGGSQKIAVLGSMNELGEASPEAHRTLGKLCDPKQLDFVVTVGNEARTYLAPEAEKRGCRVVSFMAAPDAGEFVKAHMKKGAVLLFKGSQGGVFLEEAVKVVLASPKDAPKLVRQSAAWMKQKQAFFKSVQ